MLDTFLDFIGQLILEAFLFKTWAYILKNTKSATDTNVDVFLFSPIAL